LTLVRASYEPDVNPDEGLHRFTYSLYPHPGDWQEAATLHQAAGLNQPLLAVVLPVGQAERGVGAFAPGRPGLVCDAANVVVSAIKLAEDQPASGRAVIVRVYEAHGKPAQARLQPAWPITRAEETDLIEQRVADLPVTNGSVTLQLAPHEIKTVRMMGE
jgi:alpha-mannosidase